MTRLKAPPKSGFTLVEVLIVITILGILSVVSIAVFTDTLSERRFATTLKQMKEIREALVGRWEAQSFSVANGLGMPIHASWAPHSANLVALWHLDELAGAALSDSSGVGNNATAVGVVTLGNAGKVKTSLGAAGAGGFSAPIDLSVVNTVTVAAWVNFIGCADPVRCVLWEFSSDYSAHLGFIASISDSSGGGIPAGSFSLGQQNSNGAQISYAAPISLGWHHVVAVYDRSVAGANVLQLYLDGAAAALTSLSNQNSNDNFGASTLYFLGRTASSLYTSASIDEAAVWTVALSAADVTSLYNRQAKAYRPLHRTYFGYLGDIGSLPAVNLSDLWTNPGLPAWSMDAATRMGAGWNGPYLTNGLLGTDYTKDAWGNAYVYSPAANPATLTSLGADGAIGGTGLNSDITIQIPTSLLTATVQGVIWNNDGPWSGTAQAEINAPNGAGVITQTLTNLVPANNGKFSFNSVPLGTRSITIYEPSKAGVVKSSGPFLFTVDQPNTSVLIQATGL